MAVLGIASCSSSGNNNTSQNNVSNSAVGKKYSEDGKEIIELTEKDAVYEGKFDGTEISDTDWDEQYNPALDFVYDSTEIMDVFEGTYRTLIAPKGYKFYVVNLKIINTVSNTMDFSHNKWYFRVDDTLYSMQNGLTSETKAE